MRIRGPSPARRSRSQDAERRVHADEAPRGAPRQGAIFERDGRLSKLTEEGERLLDYARRIVRLNAECMASFNESELVGRVRLGLPDDYADRYLPEILARFSRSNPGPKSPWCASPSQPDRAGPERRSRPCDHHPCGSARPSEIVRIEQLLWVTSARHGVHEERPIPLALGRPTCDWRHPRRRPSRAPVGLPHPLRELALDGGGRGGPAGLAVSVLPESAVRSRHADPGPLGRLPGLPSARSALSAPAAKTRSPMLSASTSGSPSTTPGRRVSLLTAAWSSATEV